MTSGGFRPTAPQNNFGVSATGGAGTSGKQPVRVAPGGKYGERTAMVTQQSGAPMASAPTPGNLPPIIPITAPSQLPEQSVMDGSPTGPGSNTLNLPNMQRDNSQFNANIEAYAPVLQFIASRESTSVETRKIISILLRGNLAP